MNRSFLLLYSSLLVLMAQGVLHAESASTTPVSWTKLNTGSAPPVSQMERWQNKLLHGEAHQQCQIQAWYMQNVSRGCSIIVHECRDVPAYSPAEIQSFLSDQPNQREDGRGHVNWDKLRRQLHETYELVTYSIYVDTWLQRIVRYHMSDEEILVNKSVDTQTGERFSLGADESLQDFADCALNVPDDSLSPRFALRIVANE